MTDFDHGAIDELLSSRVRLAMVAFLAGAGEADFAAIRDATKTTDGNAGVHLRKLEDAGYVTCSKSFEGRVPRTEFGLSAAGRRALEKYLSHMEALIHATREK